MTTRTQRQAAATAVVAMLVCMLGVAAASASVAPGLSPVPDRAPAALSLVIAVNAGGSAYTDGAGVDWQADKPYQAGSWGYVNGSAFSTGEQIELTQDQPLYQTERYNLDAYLFDIPNGSYDVELHLAEIYPYACPGRRVFDVQIEGATVIDDLDLFAVAGAYIPVVRRFGAAVSDGQLAVTFASSKSNAKINAIMVQAHVEGTATPTRTPSSTRTPTATGTATTTATAPAGGYPTATPPASYEVRVNAGGPAYLDSLGAAWAEDRAYAPGFWGYIGGQPLMTGHGVGATADPALYQSGRAGMSEYRFDLPNDAYRVDLRFADVYSQSCPASRIFDVSIGSSKVITGLDLSHRSAATSRWTFPLPR